ncbi:hypothetical protein [Stieleria varia]|nr:hypothetical protein [Stieleria varia]
MSEPLNPYAPIESRSAVDFASGTPRVRWWPSLVFGFFFGTALQWAAIWTGPRETEFPYMGGALLGFLTVLAYRFSTLRGNGWLLAVGVMLGNLNAFWCNKGPVMLIYWGASGNFVPSWGHALLAFVLATLVSHGFLSFVFWLVNRYNCRAPDS